MVHFVAIPTQHARAFQSGAPDAYNNAPERTTSDGGGNPCRHCLTDIPKGADMLVLAYRPFEGLQPYAETGPIFLCADACTQGGGTDIPEILTTSPDYLIKGYGFDDRIVYGTGIVVPVDRMAAQINDILLRPDVDYIHVRSSRNNCYQARVDRT